MATNYFLPDFPFCMHTLLAAALFAFLHVLNLISISFLSTVLRSIFFFPSCVHISAVLAISSSPILSVHYATIFIHFLLHICSLISLLIAARFPISSTSTNYHIKHQFIHAWNQPIVTLHPHIFFLVIPSSLQCKRMHSFSGYHCNCG